MFVINPASGRSLDVVALEKAIRDRFGGDAEVVACPPAEGMEEFVIEAERDGFDAVCAVGGDGTVHSIGRRLIGRSPALAVIPVGSGNGFARHLRIPLDPAGALEVVATGRQETIDAGSIDGMPYLMLAGIGFDAEIAERFAASSSRGLRTYVREAVSSFISYHTDSYRLLVDGEAWEGTALLIVVANSSQYGNEAKIAPLASLSDGYLDVTVVKSLPWSAAPLLLSQLFGGNLRPCEHVVMMRGRKIRVERERGGPGHVDGEPIWLGNEVEFEVIPGALRVIAPR
jgi:diacylglycerol kinase (ATP)